MANQAHELRQFSISVLYRDRQDKEFVDARGQEFVETVKNGAPTARYDQAIDEIIGHCAILANWETGIGKHMRIKGKFSIRADLFPRGLDDCLAIFTHGDQDVRNQRWHRASLLLSRGLEGGQSGFQEIRDWTELGKRAIGYFTG